MNFRKLTITFAMAAVVASFASGAEAASGHRQNPQGFDAFGSASSTDSESGVDGARARALRECNGAVTSKRDHTWGVQIGHEYRSCMTAHGQPE